MSDERSETEREIATEMRLRPTRPRVVRLSRKVLGGVAAVTGLGIGAALVFALQVGRNNPSERKELYNTEHRSTAEGLSRLPRDYSQLPKDVPALGPPLPGDLGRPIVKAQDTRDPGLQNEMQERESARLSRLFVQTATRSTGGRSVGSDMGQLARHSSASDGNSTQRSSDPHRAFLEQPVDHRVVSDERVERAASPDVIQAGTVIPAALITGLRSDLPGPVTAQVTENVYDSPSGRRLLIPQGTRLIGVYDSRVTFGQRRVLLAWTRLIFPDGRSIVLERLPGADNAGYAGLEDGVDYHWGRLFLAAGLSTLLGVSAEIGSGSDNEIARALRNGFQDTIDQTGREIVRRQLDVQPTLTVRPGFPVRVMVNRDLVLEPYTN